jgi:signal transduction histidine kinase
LGSCAGRARRRKTSSTPEGSHGRGKRLADASDAAEARESLEWLTTEKLLELIAHDINNLCHGALSYVDLALDPKLPPEARQKFLATAKQLTHRASRFTPHLRQLTELRGAKVAQLPSDPVKKAAAEGRARASELNGGATFELALSGEALEARAVGGKYLATALEHLFDNALRNGRAGTPVKVRLEATRKGELLRLRVADNGRGFQHGAEIHAGKRFSTPGSVSGAGLGLAFVRLLAERAGGSFAIEKAPSEAGEGACVVLELPEATAH